MGCGASASKVEEKLESKKVVVIIGGGYCGTKLAKALETKVNVVLIEKKDHFFHCVAALRGAVQPHEWGEKCLVPYSQLLKYGKIIQATVDEVADDLLVLSDGKKVPFDACVCCTGFTAGTGFWKPNTNTKEETLKLFQDVHVALKSASSVLIIGGGPVGIELAGEILESPPGDAAPKITLVTAASKLIDLPGIQAKLQDKLADQLTKKGVELIFGERVESGVDTTVLGMHPSSTVIISGGKTLSADVVFVATGPKPALPEKHPFHLAASGRITVDKSFQCIGARPGFFALGDCAETGDLYNAYHGGMQVDILVKNVLTFCETGATSALAAYKGTAAAMLVPIGKSGGAGQLPFGVVGGGMTGVIKGKDLFTNQFWKDMGFKSSKAVSSANMEAVPSDGSTARLNKRMSQIMNVDEDTFKKEYGNLDA